MHFSERHTWTTLTVWQSVDAVAQLADDPEYQRLTAGIAALNVLRPPQLITLHRWEGGAIDLPKRFGGDFDLLRL